jgi:alpha-D-ribose 1-methylphosphonate 5-triphosphate synthase subunit PhnI
MKATRKTSLARGTRGFLLRSVDDAGCSRYFFRAYGADHSFRDYELIHSDLEIEIVDEEATFYDAEDGRAARLDHSPRTLGREE